jgi:type I restriction enzyme S subunit
LKGLGEEIKQGGSGGSVLSNLSTGRFLTLKALFASDEARHAFQNVTMHLFDRISLNEAENVTLSQTLDLLLPKLMSGEIRVKDAEAIAEAVA